MMMMMMMEMEMIEQTLKGWAKRKCLFLRYLKDILLHLKIRKKNTTRQDNLIVTTVNNNNKINGRKKKLNIFLQ